MATATTYVSINMNAWTFYSTVGLSANNSQIVEDHGGGRATYYVGSFSFDAFGDLSGGTLNQVYQYLNGALQYNVTGLSHGAVTVSNFLDNDDPALLPFLFSGNDTINGSAFADVLNGFTGNNTIYGNGGNDALYGGNGNDLLNGGLGNDTLVGGFGDDTYVVNVSSDLITEFSGQGTDTVQAAYNYSLGSTLENLVLTGAAFSGTGNAANNRLTGNGLNNFLNGSAGNDTMLGGTGNDTYVVNVSTDVVFEAAGAGTDTVQTYAGSFTLPANVENLVFTGGSGISGTGNSGNNVITGNGGHNTLNGGAGNDTLNGGIGNDNMTGGAGNDLFIVNVAADTVNEAVSGGTDTVHSSFSYTLGPNVENLLLLGSAGISGTGNSLANVITGNSGHNLINGMGGADTLNGGDGHDTLVWDAVDVAVNGGVGSDTLRVDGTGQHLNLQAIPSTKIQNVEVIDITGSGNNTLTLSIQDVLDLSSTTNTLRVDGNAGDSVQRSTGWTQGADVVIGANTYFSFTGGGATLWIDNDMSLGT